jgi:hypothetical protein
MTNEIKITFKSVYGETKAYPANQQAQNLTDLIGTKTLTHRTLCQAEKMGFLIVEVDRFGRTVGNVVAA